MSPFVSQAQRSWMYANKPAMAKKWEAHTPDKKLPAKKLPAKKSASKSKPKVNMFGGKKR